MAERNTASAVGAISNLRKDDAIVMLQRTVGGREELLLDVYDYWVAKRKKWGKPILRRLQAPTSASDSNPFLVFR